MSTTVPSSPPAPEEPKGSQAARAVRVRRDEQRPASVDAVSATIFLFAAAAVYVRLHFGIDFTDESYYSALPYSFVLGHRPLQDEIAMHQFAGLMLVPAVKLYVEAVGSSDGLVFFMRHLYLAYALVCSLVIATRLGRVVGRGVALQMAALLLVHVPFSIPSLSYNTLASFGLLLGLLLVAFSGSSRRPGLDLFLGTLALGSACFAYPPLALAALPALIWGAVLQRASDRERSLASIALPIALAGAIWLAAVAFVLHHWDGVSGVQRLLAFNAAMAKQGGGGGKLFDILLELTRERAMLLAMAAVAASAALILRFVEHPVWRPALLLLAGPCLLLAGQLQHPLTEPYTTTTFFVSTLGVTSLFALVPDWEGRERTFDSRLALIGACSLVAGACVLWATANGLRNAALGLAPACLVGLVLLIGDAAHESDEPLPEGPKPRRSAHAAVSILMASIIGYGLVDLYGGVYRDQPISALRVRMDDGPYAGIATSRERKAFIDALSEDLVRARAAGSSILFFDYFPAGYLFVDMVPATPALWMFPSAWQLQGNDAIREHYARHFDGDAAHPDVVVLMRAVPFRDWVDVRLPDDDPVLRRLSPNDYEAMLSRPSYLILQRKSAARGSLDHSR